MKPGLFFNEKEAAPQVLVTRLLGCPWQTLLLWLALSLETTS